MSSRKIILASASPRRKRLLEQIGLKFTIDVSRYKEDMGARRNPYELVGFLSFQKAKDVSSRHENAVIIAADTIVVFDGEAMGKPKDEKEAKRMLKKLSGTVHSVVTGFTIIDTQSGKTITKSVEGKIHMI